MLSRPTPRPRGLAGDTALVAVAGLSMSAMPEEVTAPEVVVPSSWDEELPFSPGSEGTGVADLQQRLDRLGYSVSDDIPGEYGDRTSAAVKAFQRDRGLRCDGVCGRHTWSSLVEAGYRLGDRLLYRRTPMLHGDDVAHLQAKLSALGFDPGRVDGIFGDQTASALADFQHNIGLAPDGICGPHTLAELDRLAPRPGGEQLVSGVRERLRLHGASTLSGRTIAIGETGGFQIGTSALARALANAGAKPLTLHQPDELEQAELCNRAGVDCYLGLRLDPARGGIRTLYYSGYRYESEASKHLAALLLARLVDSLSLADEGSEGMALEILRRTRMPAVVVEFGQPSVVAMHTTRLADAVTEAIGEWVEKDWQ